MSRTRSARLHDALAAHVASGAMPGLVALVSRRGEAQVEAISRREHGRHPDDPAHDGLAAGAACLHRFLDVRLQSIDD